LRGKTPGRNGAGLAGVPFAAGLIFGVRLSQRSGVFDVLAPCIVPHLEYDEGAKND